MDDYENIGISILKNFFDYYCEEKLDDAEYIPVVKVIINGIQESMLSSGVPEISKDQLEDIIQNVVRKTNTGPDEFEELDLSMFSTIDEQLEFLKQQDRVDTMYIM